MKEGSTEKYYSLSRLKRKDCFALFNDAFTNKIGMIIIAAKINSSQQVFKENRDRKSHTISFANSKINSPAKKIKKNSQVIRIPLCI